MTITTKDDMLSPQILVDVIRGEFRGKNAFMGSTLVSSGAVSVNGSMPKGGQGAIGKLIDVPYFGTIGEFADNPDGSSVTPQKLGQVMEQATIARSSLAVETSVWAQGVGQVDPALGDPYQEGAMQARAAAVREMDKQIISKIAATPLVMAKYSATVPSYLDWDAIIDATSLWGDEGEDIVAMVTHSRAIADLAKLRDSTGRPLLLQSMTEGSRMIRQFNGVPLIVSDRTPLTGSTMGTVTSSGTTPPTVTLAVSDATKLGPWNLIIDCVVGGSSNGTATFRFSVDGGSHYSATIVIPSGGGAIVLNDTATDSLVGVNGKTGITATFANGTYNADNQWVSTANLKVSSLILQSGAAAFWYNAGRLGTKQDTDILADTDIIALHLYYVAHLYRRRRMGTRPGVVALTHNVRGYVG